MKEGNKQKDEKKRTQQGMEYWASHGQLYDLVMPPPVWRE
jgi:hypothetical protein